MAKQYVKVVLPLDARRRYRKCCPGECLDLLIALAGGGAEAL